MIIRLLFVCCFFLALASIKTFPLILHLGTRTASDPGDPLLNAWILAWDVHALTTNPLRLFDANIFYPVERSLAFSDHLLGVLPIFAPVYLLTGNPMTAYNTLLLLSFALSGLAAFGLCYHWTRAFWPSLVAGMLFGFAPFRFGQLSHVQILNFFWAPVALLFLDRFLRTRRWRDLGGFAGFYWLQVLASAYLAYMMTVAVALYVGYYVVIVDRTLLRLSMAPKTLAFAGASLAVLLPPNLPYLEVDRSWSASRSIDEISRYSPDLLGYLAAPPLMNDLYVSLFNPLEQWAAHEKWLFPGLLLPVLVLLGSRSAVGGLPFLQGRQLRQVFWCIMGVAVLISLGPYLIVLGHKTRIPLPYLLLYHFVPGFAGLRVPGRFALLAVLAATPLAAVGALRCCEVVGRLVPTMPRRLAASVASAGLVGLFLLELGWKPLPLVRVPASQEILEVYRWLAAERPGPIAEIPFGRWDDYRYLYLSTVHWLPLVNGQSGFFPPTYAESKAALAELPAQRAVEYAGALGIRTIVVHGGRFPIDESSRWSDGKLVGDSLRKVAAFGPDVVYALPPVRTASSLAAEVSAPDWLPAGKRVRLGLLLHSDEGRPWVHPRPHGRSEAVIQWTDALSNRITTEKQLLLPLVVRAGETIAVPFTVRPPATPGPYTFQLSIPSRGVATKPRAVEVRESTFPTSRDAPDLLSAAYALHHGARPLIVTEPGPLTVELLVTNTGKTVWLADAKGGKGVVKLAWRWFREGRELSELSGRAPIRYDVFLGQDHRFRVAVDPPRDSGSYVLELGLVSERIASFSKLGTSPLRLVVEIRSDPTQAFSIVLERLRSPTRDAARLSLSEERVGDTSRLVVRGSIGKRSWFVDVYLALEGPDGVLRFHDGSRLVVHGNGPWIPLGKGIELRKGTHASGPLVTVPLAEMRPGNYTWYLLLTDADSYRIVADARTSFEITP